MGPTVRAWLQISGAFTIALGIAHIFFPRILGFRETLVESKTALALPLTSYVPSSRDRYGLILVMNSAVTFVLLSIGVADICHEAWLKGVYGRVIAFWIAGWWLLRAIEQRHLGFRAFDCAVAVGFSVLAAVHVLAGLICV